MYSALNVALKRLKPITELPTIWHHRVLPATRRKWTRAAWTPAKQVGTWFTYPGGMEDWVELGVMTLVICQNGLFICPETDNHSSKCQPPDSDPTGRRTHQLLVLSLPTS